MINIDKYKVAANITEYHIVSKVIIPIVFEYLLKSETTLYVINGHTDILVLIMK